MRWAGGTPFTSLVIQPVLRREVPEGARMAVYAAVGRRLTAVQWGTWGTLLATGLWKLHALRETPEVFFGPFGRILAVKLTLATGMAVLSLIHAFWGQLNGLLMVGIVFCAALLRFNPW